MSNQNYPSHSSGYASYHQPQQQQQQQQQQPYGGQHDQYQAAPSPYLASPQNVSFSGHSSQHGAPSTHMDGSGIGHQGGPSPFQNGPQFAPPPQQHTPFSEPQLSPGAYDGPPVHHGNHDRASSPYYGQPQHTPTIHEPGQGPPGSDFDPGAGVEGERGLGKAILGGVAGGFLGHKAGGHGMLGAIGGAVAANMLGRDKKKHKHDRYDDEDSLAYGSSTYGGSNYSHASGGSGGHSSAAMGGLYAGSSHGSGRHHHHHGHHKHGSSHSGHSRRHSSRSRSRGDGYDSGGD